MTTRRWYYLIPAQGQPRGLVHAIERHNLDALPGRQDRSTPDAQQLDTGLTQLLTGVRRVAMEYSPMCAIPYLSRVDAGTAEAVRARGVEIVSSGDLVQQFEAAWTPAQLATHRSASEALYRIKDRAFAAAAAAVRGGACADRVRAAAADGRLVRRRKGWSATRRRSSRSARNAGNPHYLPTARAVAADRRPTRCCCSTCGARQATPGAVFADITWVGVTGVARARRGRARVRRRSPSARDAAVALVAGCGARRARAARLGSGPRGAARCSSSAGYGDAHPAPHRATASARTSMAMACTSTTTRRTTIGGCCRAPASRSSLGCISRRSACGPRSTCIRGEREALGHRPATDEIVTLRTLERSDAR